MHFELRVVFEKMINFSTTIFDRFRSKKQRSFFFENVYEAVKRHTNRKEGAESSGEHHRMLALMSVKTLTKNSFFENGNF